MEKCIKSCKCGSTTFVTEPNSYDVYELESGKLEFQYSELIEEKIKLYCNECGKEFIEE